MAKFVFVAAALFLVVNLAFFAAAEECGLSADATASLIGSCKPTVQAGGGVIYAKVCCDDLAKLGSSTQVSCLCPVISQNPSTGDKYLLLSAYSYCDLTTINTSGYTCP